MENYYKNFILCGEIDYFCLLCKEAFDNPTSVAKHLRWEKHRKLVNDQEYMAKYISDYIYKIYNFYYCEVCNSLSTDLSDHIKKNSHQVRKTNPKIIDKKPPIARRNPDNSIAIENKLITQNHWHCIEGGTCLLCDSNVGRINSHKSSFRHMVNLIQSNVKCANNNHYRELKEDKFYCFQCFKVYENKCLASHWSDNDILEDGKNSKSKVTNSNCDANKHKNIDLMIEILAKTEKDDFDINVDNKTAKCVKCETLVELKYKALIEHKNSHKDPNCEDEICSRFYIDHGKRRSELAKYGKENYINLNQGGSKGFCSLCNIYISAHLNVAKQHVEGAYHRGFLELKGLVKDKKHKKPSCKLVNFKIFIDVRYGPFQFPGYNLIVINDGICLDVLSFSFICVINDFRGIKAKCYACDTTIDWKDAEQHAKEHSNIVLQCTVVCLKTESDEEEFIRQLPSGLYHCGYCNKVYPFWENMLKHLKNMKHDIQKKKSRLLSIICAKLLLNPFLDVDDIEEFVTLQELELFE